MVSRKTMTQCSEMNLEDILQLLEKASPIMSKLDKSLNETSQISEKFGEMIDTFLVELTNLFTSLCVHLKNRQLTSLDDQSTLRSIVKDMSKFVRGDGQLRINKLSAERAVLIQSAMEFVVCFYKSSFASVDFKFKLVQDNIDRGEFLVRLDDRIKLEDEFDKFVVARMCTDFQRIAMSRALNTAYEVKRNGIRDTLTRQRMLEFIGHPKERVIADQLQDLTELMPDLSKQQLHLCLRHFGYDFEQTLGNLCEREKLPLELKTILRINDSFDDLPHFDKKMLPIVDDADNANGTADGGPLLVNDAHYGAFNLKRLNEALNFLERTDDEVELDGKILIRQQFREKEEGQTEEEATKLRAVNLREAEATEQDAKLAAEVGHSGRFNRPGLSAAMDPYEDEYDDTFEHAQLYSQVDGGATTADEKETMNVKMPRKHLAERPQNEPKNGGNSIHGKAKPRQEANSSANAKEATRKQNSSTIGAIDRTIYVFRLERNNCSSVPMDPSLPLRRRLSAELVPDSSAQFLLELETHAQSIASGIDMALRDLRGSLRGMSDLTCESTQMFGSVVNSTCDSVDASIRSMYTMLAKTEEFNESMRGIEKLLQQIKDIKRLLDLFEEHFIVGIVPFRQ
uniref:CUE domain-containing protein n=1 Tax=Globodera rostochiensis TaxID=31243 RepID=A0A914GTI3_GLORO